MKLLPLKTPNMKLLDDPVVLNTEIKQESPPAWTQEAYRPRRIKYYSVGYPPCRGTPLARSDRGYPRWGSPQLGYPLVGVPPIRVPPSQVPPAQNWLRYPPPGPGWGTPPHLDLAQVSPSPGPGWGTSRLDLARVSPLGVDRQNDGWTDTCQNITFPRTTYAVGNNHSTAEWRWNATHLLWPDHGYLYRQGRYLSIHVNS